MLHRQEAVTRADTDTTWHAQPLEYASYSGQNSTALSGCFWTECDVGGAHSKLKSTMCLDTPCQRTSFCMLSDYLFTTSRYAPS
jgi:hypothetical protein